MYIVFLSFVPFLSHFNALWAYYGLCLQNHHHQFHFTHVLNSYLLGIAIHLIDNVQVENF